MKNKLPQRLAKSMRGTAKKILPEVCIREVRQFRACDKTERLVYLKVRISAGLGFPNKKLLRAPKTARRFVFVCFGNIIRSPMCEALMRRELDRIGHTQLSVTSAGLNATPGRSPDLWAVTAAHEMGISLENHRAQLLTRELVHQADAIFAMDFQNYVQLVTRWKGAEKKIFMLAAYAPGEYRSVEISDPYYQGQQQTRSCYRLINDCIHNLIRDLEQ